MLYSAGKIEPVNLHGGLFILNDVIEGVLEINQKQRLKRISITCELGGILPCLLSGTCTLHQHCTQNIKLHGGPDSWTYNSAPPRRGRVLWAAPTGAAFSGTKTGHEQARIKMGSVMMKKEPCCEERKFCLFGIRNTGRAAAEHWHFLVNSAAARDQHYLERQCSFGSPHDAGPAATGLARQRPS